MEQFVTDMRYADVVVAHNYTSDLHKIAKDMYDRSKFDIDFELMYKDFMDLCKMNIFVDTMVHYKKLYSSKVQMRNSVLYTLLTNIEADKSLLHDAMYDVYLTKWNFIKLHERENIKSTDTINYGNLHNVMERYINKSRSNHNRSLQTISNDECR